MQLRNSREGYGLVAIALHWLVALVVFAIFALGLWMSELDLYHPWYHRAPALHKSIGLLLFGVVTLRLLWRLGNPQPAPLPSHTPLQQFAARSVHRLLYLLLFLTMLFGYLISTADGRGVEIFALLEIPATLTSLPEQEDVAGVIHATLAFILIGVVLLHAAAALKHHFIDRDPTLLRMVGRTTPTTTQGERQ